MLQSVSRSSALDNKACRLLHRPLEILQTRQRQPGDHELAMADTPEKKSVEATSDQPRLTSNDNNSSDADKDLAAMGYKPVSRLQS